MKPKLARREDVALYLSTHKCTMPEMAKNIGIRYKRMRRRLDNEETVEAIIADPNPTRSKNPDWTPVDNPQVKAYLKDIGRSFKEEAERIGINLSTVKTRIGHGWPVDEAFNKPIKERAKRSPAKIKVGSRADGRSPAALQKRVRLTATPPKNWKA